MKKSTKRVIFLSIAALVVTLPVVGYFIYNKKHVNVAAAEAVKTTAADLYKTFSTDSVSAKKQYTEKIVQVSGEISSISKNQQNQPIILLKTNTEGASVNCTLEGPLENSAAGNHIEIKGVCNGIGQGDLDLGIPGDVYLVRCYIQK